MAKKCTPYPLSMRSIVSSEYLSSLSSFALLHSVFPRNCQLCYDDGVWKQFLGCHYCIWLLSTLLNHLGIVLHPSDVGCCHPIICILQESSPWGFAFISGILRCTFSQKILCGTDSRAFAFWTGWHHSFNQYLQYLVVPPCIPTLR